MRRSHILNRLLMLVGGCWAVCSEIDPSPVNDSGWAVPKTITCAGSLTSFQQDVIDRYVTGNLGEVDPCIPPLLRQQNSRCHGSPHRCRRSIVVFIRSLQQGSPASWVRRIFVRCIDHSRRATSEIVVASRIQRSAVYGAGYRQLIQVFNENLAGLYVVPCERGTRWFAATGSNCVPAPLALARF